MARGGKRKGAGRPKGGHDKVSAALRAKAAEAGELPHEFLLRLSRGGMIEHGAQEIPVSLEMRFKAAINAAPFYAPKLANVTAEVSGPDGGAIVTRIERVIVDPKT